MFSKQIQIILRVLGNALLFLANMQEDDTRQEMSASDYLKSIPAADVPDAGTDVTPVITNTAAEVFAPPPANEVAAAVFAPAEPIYTMTEAAGEFSREDYHATNWTDEMLVERGMMTVVYPSPAPVKAAPVPPQPNPGQQVAMQAVADDAAAFQATMKDTEGLPWDGRIHSSSRTQTAKGVWTKRKNVSATEVARVTAELLQAAPAPVTPPFTPLAAPAPAPVAPAPVAPPAAVAAPAPAPVPPAPATGATKEPATFMELVGWMNSVGLTPAHALPHCTAVGLEGFGLLAIPTNAALVPMVYQGLLAQRK